ncbi:MAG: aldehyde ferredoxin oxidoreductase family protein [Bacillota bacterium]
MPGGYVGKFARIDLTRRRVETFCPDEEILRGFIGGGGLGARMLQDETGPKTNPLGPDNPLMLFTGPLTGTRAITSSRYAVVAKSPLTGIAGEADSGGYWGALLKFAGYDGLMITGQAESPVYLWVHDGEVEIRDAGHLWGKDTFEVDEIIRGETHKKASVASIGQAGENLVAFACVMNEGKHSRAAGRTGLGAVMGSKKLKAVAVHGKDSPKVADPKALGDSVKGLAPVIVEKMKRYTLLGTPGGVVSNALISDLPVKNWTIGDWVKDAEVIGGERMAKTVLVGRYYCRGCVIGCGRTVRVDSGPYKGVDGGGPEYETLAGLGSLCLVNDLEAICMANELCNRYGIDTISAGGVIAFALEAYEKGFLTKGDTGGQELRWGDPSVVLDLVRKIAFREGIGDLLACGVRKASEELGKGTEGFAIHVKGLEPAFHDPRAMSSLAVGYATHNRGACHRGNSHALERYTIPDIGHTRVLGRMESGEKGTKTALLQNYSELFNSLKLCQFLFSCVPASSILGWVRAVTGWDMEMEEFLQAGERIFNLKRLYNMRHGVSRKDDTIPHRIATLRFADGGSKDFVPDLEPMLEEYYKARGWDADGGPTRRKLAELGLEHDAPPRGA